MMAPVVRVVLALAALVALAAAAVRRAERAERERRGRRECTRREGARAWKANEIKKEAEHNVWWHGRTERAQARLKKRRQTGK